MENAIQPYLQACSTKETKQGTTDLERTKTCTLANYLSLLLQLFRMAKKTIGATLLTGIIMKTIKSMRLVTVPKMETQKKLQRNFIKMMSLKIKILQVRKTMNLQLILMSYDAMNTTLLLTLRQKKYKKRKKKKKKTFLSCL